MIKGIKMQYFEEFLKKINFEKQLKKMAKVYKNKKILIYGAGSFYEVLHSNYDLSCLNIIGISDKNKTAGNVQTLYGYPAIKPGDIKKINPDVILVGLPDPIYLIEALKIDYSGIKIAPLVNKDRIEFLREILKI
ncbi:MAG: hypothetical protein A2Y25_01565 [Candidatus Melainabacteria bacterium GWF2_37_15]|nr:MAG: hypothetical protein A2Y25_01565 [Candidatus Melainabacteria bacterium GWF2_37_15]